MPRTGRHLIVEPHHRDVPRPARVDAGFDGCADVVDVRVDIPHFVPDGDNGDGVSDAGERVAQGCDVRVWRVEQVLDLEAESARRVPGVRVGRAHQHRSGGERTAGPGDRA